MRRAIAGLPAALGLLGAMSSSEPAALRAGEDHVLAEDVTLENVPTRVPPPAPNAAPYGDPVTQGPPPAWRMLHRDGFVVAYDEGRRNPAWVTYTYTFGPDLHPGHKRIGFSTDMDTDAKVGDGDYTNTGYSRGHMAPSFGIFTFFGKAAQKQAYLMSNIVPQKQPMNAGPWEDAEDRTANKYAKAFGTVWTIDGPVYPKKPKTVSSQRIFVPEATFKIILRHDADAGQPRVMAFIMPQTARQKDAAVEYLTSVDEVERRTGLDFVRELPDELEDALERVRETALWKVEP